MKKYFSYIIAMAFSLMSAKAQTVSVSNVTIKAGETKVVSIYLNNPQTNIVSFQMDLSLPDGVTIDKAGCSLGSRITDASQELVIGKQPDGSFRLISTSLALTPISGTSGEIVKLSLTASNGSIGGTASLKNVILATSNSQKLTPASTSFNVNVSYTLTYTVDGVTYNTSSVTYGTALSAITPPNKEGYTFSGWSGLPATMPNYDVVVTGSFTINSYTLTYMIDGEEYKTETIVYGSAITPESVPTREGYTFSGWSGLPTTMPAHNVVVTGTFTINYYTLTYMVDGAVYKTLSVKYGSTLTPIAAPTKEGYTFSGWSEIPASMPAHNVVVTGSFTINSYTLTYMVDGEEYKTFTIKYGTVLTPEPAPTKEGHTFSGWNGLPATMPAHDVTVTGKFTVNSYILTYKVDGVVYKSFSVTYGTALTPIAAPTKEGHTFSGWSEIPASMPAHDVVVTGTFTINSYTLTYMVDGQVYKTYSVVYGTKITPEPVPVKEGYTFSGWTFIPATMPASNVIVVGSFTIDSYSLTYMVDGEEYKTMTIEYGSEITPENEPTKEGYTFSGWSEIPETMPAEDVIVTGSFMVNSYTLSYIVDGEEYKTDSIAYGTTLIPEEEPTKEGYTFSGWSYIPETMPAEDVVIKGSFSINQYLLTYILDGEEYASYEIDYNTVLTPETVPDKKGMNFSGWGEMPETMPAHNVTLTGAYNWLKETVDGVIYEVADTLNNYVSIIGYEDISEEIGLLSYIEMGGDVYEVYSIADNALPKDVTIYTSIGRLLLWLWTNGYENIKETGTGRSLSVPEMSLVATTASSLTISFANQYPELTETVIVSGSPVEKKENIYEIALTGLEPDKLYEGIASFTISFEDASYTKSYSFRTNPLVLTGLQPKVVSIGNVIVAAETNLNDEETNVGFEWRRTDWTDDFESRTGVAYLYEGIMEGYIRSLNHNYLWKFRPYYTSNSGNTYYGDWKGMDPSDYSYFEPTVHTYAAIAVTDSTAEVKGYVMQGTDNVTTQGFMYWQNTPTPSSRKKVPVDAVVVKVPGHVMKTTLGGLDYDTEYCFVAFVTTSEGETFYGEQQTFRTTSDPDGIEEVKASEEATEVARYDLQGRMIAKPQKGINIIRYSDGTSRKVLIK